MEELQEQEEQQDHARDSRDIKRSLRIEYGEFDLHVFAIAVHKTHSFNESLKIPCHVGESLCPEVFDIIRDCHYVDGVAWHEVGSFPISFRMIMEGVPGWEMDIPVPPSVIRRYMTETQKERLREWKSHYGYGNSDYEIQFFQIMHVY